MPDHYDPDDELVEMPARYRPEAAPEAEAPPVDEPTPKSRRSLTQRLADAAKFRARADREPPS